MIIHSVGYRSLGADMPFQYLPLAPHARETLRIRITCPHTYVTNMPLTCPPVPCRFKVTMRVLGNIFSLATHAPACGMSPWGGCGAVAAGFSVCNVRYRAVSPVAVRGSQ